MRTALERCRRTKAATVTIARSGEGERNDELVEKGTKTHASRRISLDRATLVSSAMLTVRSEPHRSAPQVSPPKRCSLRIPRMAAHRGGQTGVTLAFGCLLS